MALQPVCTRHKPLFQPPVTVFGATLRTPQAHRCALIHQRNPGVVCTRGCPLTASSDCVEDDGLALLCNWRARCDFGLQEQVSGARTPQAGTEHTKARVEHNAGRTAFSTKQGTQGTEHGAGCCRQQAAWRTTPRVHCRLVVSHKRLPCSSCAQWAHCSTMGGSGRWGGGACRTGQNTPVHRGALCPYRLSRKPPKSCVLFRSPPPFPTLLPQWDRHLPRHRANVAVLLLFVTPYCALGVPKLGVCRLLSLAC